MKMQMFLLSMVVGLAPIVLSGMVLRKGKQLPGVARPAAAAAAAAAADVRLEDWLLEAAKEQDAGAAIAVLKTGVNPAVIDDATQKSFLSIVAGWQDQQKINCVLAHLKTTMKQDDLYRIVTNAGVGNRAPFELAAANKHCAAVVPFLEAIDNKEMQMAMLAGKDIWHEAIIRGHVGSLRHLLKLLKDTDRLIPFLLEKHIWGDLPLHVAARNNRENSVYALFEYADAALQKQMLVAHNKEKLTPHEVAGDEAMRGLLNLYSTETL